MRKVAMMRSLALILACSLICSQIAAQSAGGVFPMNESRKNERQLLRYIQPVLDASQLAARLNYVGDCQSNGDWPVPFPDMHLRPPESGKVGVAAAQNIFRNERRESVSGDNRIILIRMQGVPDALLNTRISALIFDPISQYNPNLAIATVIGSREVRAAMRKLNVSTPTLPINVLLSRPDPSLPHIPATMRDVSMDDALDEIATAFHGIVFYGVCRKSPVFQIYFDGGSGFVR